jgi:hypothetical protein
MELLEVLLRLSKPSDVRRKDLLDWQIRKWISAMQERRLSDAPEKPLQRRKRTKKSRDVPNSSLMQRWEKWSKNQPNPKNPYNWPAIIKYWQDEGHWDHVANHTNVTETWSSEIRAHEVHAYEMHAW